ncbi:TIM barrel protein [Burkholderia vietnamiensis]|uniref:TIM barrel protein n=1 Tax=Burkholderia vietnamiensis TaxID=60552 RepID=UPI0007587452|nr:TIM barrel protein [Burkholderia vietnamiensis]KVF35035.1 AP endonuclease [Burkholderia vietnamiensis]KVF40145.1 AP endonuclease [Burkholderia vietnamiensis]MBR8033567.1 TIM barrel protein [Burkholderia vietnamiensis]MBR8219207.1 TIM barrel protein [Burkholderia vietnamiensis]MBR8285068.1 TIM barrel protein [Burkholderia vietnamiensis]
MSIKIACAPCCWGVDDPKNPHLPKWERVLEEAGQAGYRGIELGPYGYIPLDVARVSHELKKNGLNIIAGTIFDDLAAADNLTNLLRQTHEICALITKLPQPPTAAKQKFPTPYLVVMDWGHPERDVQAGHPERALRLVQADWERMMSHIRQIAELAWKEYGVRAVIHPHAGGYIEFADEIQQLLVDIPYKTAGLCLDTGHLYYSKMDPLELLREYADRLDYVHFKDIDLAVYGQVMNEEIAFFDACAKGVMCPIGKGVIDYPAIKQLLDEIGYQGYITVEQERDPRNADSSLRDVTASREYLGSVGLN